MPDVDAGAKKRRTKNKAQRFTDAYLRNLKPRALRYEEIEAGRTGLAVRVAVSGIKTLSYLYRFDGTAKRMTLGIYRDRQLIGVATSLQADQRGVSYVTLADARVALEEARRKRSGGVDPSPEAVRQHQLERKAKSIDELADAYLARYASQKRASSADIDRRILNREIRPVWGSRRTSGIQRIEIVELLNGIVDRGAKISANRTYTLLRNLFRFAVKQAIIPASPMVEIGRPGGRETMRSRVLDDAEIIEFWIACEQLGYPFGTLFRFMLAVGQRRGECAGLRRSEIDVPSKLWLVPGSRMKGHLAHEVPLSPLAFEIIETLPATGEYLFRASIDGKDRPATGFARAKAQLDALIVEGRSLALKEAGGSPEKATPMAPWRLHDLRRTMRTHLSRMRLDPEISERVIGHLPAGVRKTYDVHDYRREKAEVLTAWSGRLKTIVSPVGPAGGRVVQFRAASS